MRFYRKATIVISEDDTATPKEVRFKSEDAETIEGATSTLVKDALSNTVTIPASATDFALPMPQVTTGKYLYLYGDRVFHSKINGGAARVHSLKKHNEEWIDFTSVTITNPDATNALRLTWAIAGD